MKTAVLGFFFLAGVVGFGHAQEAERWVLLRESWVEVSGTSNVNTFTCMISHPLNMQYLTKRVSGSTASFAGTILLVVDAFDCGNQVMNRDFTRTLKQDEYPHIALRLIGMRGDRTNLGVRVLEGEVEIEIAGVNHRLVMRCTLEDLRYGRRRIRGAVDLRFSDFGLEPPRRALGLVRVENDISVEFSLLMEKSD